MNIAAFLESSSIYGPGNRFVIWFQGCSLRCKGCWNMDLWPFEDKFLFRPQAIFNKIKETDGIEGVSFLGGEPLDQAEDLLILVKMLKDNGYSIMLYTGYEEQEISGTVKEEVFRLSDIAVSGRYIESMRSVYLKWRGSMNQKIIFNTDIYRNYESVINERENDIEIHIDDAGGITVTGYPEPEDLEEILYGKDNN